MILAGVANPLTDLPDLHAVLDVAEMMLTENMDEKERRRYNMKMYEPEEGQVPKGFSAEEQRASFDAFEAYAGDMD